MNLTVSVIVQKSVFSSKIFNFMLYSAIITVFIIVIVIYNG